MRDWAGSGAIKVDRAKQYISYFEDEVKAFLARQPYRIEEEGDPQTGERVLRLRVRQYPSIALGAVAGDALHNLRSSLDILWHHVTEGKKSPSRSKHTDGFPIRETEAELLRQFGRDGNGPMQPIVRVIRECKPYRGGDDDLWLLHHLDIQDKHQMLLPAFAGVAPIDPSLLQFMADIQAGAYGTPGTFAPPKVIDGRLVNPLSLGGGWMRDGDRRPRLSPAHDGMELTRFNPKDMRPGTYAEFRVAIIFGEGEAKDMRIADTLHDCVAATERVIRRFSDLQLLR